MERLFDKVILLVCTFAFASALAPGAKTVAVLLVGAAATLAVEVLAGGRTVVAGRVASLRTAVSHALPCALCLSALAMPEAVIAVPLVAYDLAGSSRCVLALAAPVAWLASWRTGAVSSAVLLVSAVLALVAYILARRTEATRSQRESNRCERDRLAARSQRLEAQMRDLSDKRELEVRVAVLEERSRIAREIHDNVGHLLTRAHLQAQAYQVVFTADEDVRRAFAALGDSLGEALDTVRASVHDLHDERIDLAAQIARIARESGLAVACTIEADAAPPRVAACLSAVAREALSNAARHGATGKARLSLTEHPGFWRLAVENDIGAVSASAAGAADGSASPSGMGLVSLEERVRALGGTFRAGPVGVRDGVAGSAGWRVLASIPKRRGGEAS